MSVAHILSVKGNNVVSTHPDRTLKEAAQIMAQHGIGAILVFGVANEIAGILSERDIVRDLGRRGSVCLEEKVDALMTRNLISCAPGDNADTVLEKMTAGRFRHMPVMDRGEMVGIISIGDVVAARISELAMEKDALEGMIKGN